MFKRIIYVTALLLLLSGSLFAGGYQVKEDYRFSEKYHYPEVLIVCFTMETVGNMEGRIDFTLEGGTVHTKIDSFNDLAREYGIINMERMFDYVTHPEWSDEDGAHIQNIFRLYLEDNDRIEQANIALNNDPNIIYAAYEAKQFLLYTPNDPDFHRQWKHPVIQTPQAWDYVKGSSEIIVSITDTGAKWNHPDLADNIWINEAEMPGITIDWQNGQILGGDGIDNDGNGRIDDVMGWDFFHNNNNPYQNYPGNSHGTHVAGIAGAVGDNEIGIAGVAMNVSLMICKGASSYAPSEGIRDGYHQIQYSAQTGAHIINCSWISYTNQGSYAINIVNYATRLGSLVIAGAGNDNVRHTPSFQAYPSDAPNALSVAATNQNDIKANFSDYGAPIGISAPGVSILSTWRNNGYHTTQGTSMATPVVSGVAALVKTLHPDLTPNQLMYRLQNTSDDINELNPNYVGLLGAGRVNAFRAVMFDRMPLISLGDYEISEYQGDGDGVPNPGEEVSLILSIYNEVGWMRAEDVTVTVTTEAEGVTMTAGEVAFPNIDGGSFGFNFAEPIRFTTVPELQDLNIPLKVTINANENTPFPFEDSFDITVSLSLQKAGWPLSLEGASTSPAIIKDIDGNGFNEIIFGDPQGKIHVLKANREYVPGFPAEVGNNINAGVAIADLNNSGTVEIVANTSAGIISAVDNEGRILFQYDTEAQFRNNPLIADVDKSGECEIVAATFTNPRLFVLRNDGSDYPNFPVNLDAGVVAPPAAADLNGDGFQEIVIITTGGNMHAISTATGSDIAGFPVSLGGASWNGATISYITDNTKPQIAVVTVQGNLFIFDAEGNQLVQRSLGSPIRTDVLVFDLNNNGSKELILGDMLGRLYVLDASGNDIEPFPINVGAAIESSPILADMTRDRNFEIIFGDGQGFLHSIDLSGNNTPNFPINLQRAFSVSAAIGYVGNVENPDILIPNQNGYQFVDFKRIIGHIGWATFKGNARRTGTNLEMTSTEHHIVRPDTVTDLTGNFPNPFNPNTTISFEVGNKAGDSPVAVNITVYNIRGQAVATLIDEKMPPGQYSVQWNGRDSSGNEVGSGIYFYTLQTADITMARKMMLVK